MRYTEIGQAGTCTHNYAESIDRMDDDRDGELLGAVERRDDEESRIVIADFGSTPVPADLFHRLRSRLESLLPKSADPAFVLRSLQQFIAASRSPTALLALFERDDSALSTLLRLLGAGQRLTQWLIADPEAFDLVRASDGGETSRETLVDEILAEWESLSAQGSDRQTAGRVLRSVFGRERLRIAFAEVIHQAPPGQVAGQLSILADALIESAVQCIRGELVMRYGEPRMPDGRPGRFAVIGLGPLGGHELSYDSSLDLIFLRDLCEPTDGQINLPADEFFDRLATGVLDLLSHPFENSEPIYDVASSHRPLTEDGSLALTNTQAHRHYQLMGRTWERLLYVKSRCVAGDESLGDDFLERMQPWIYRRYLERADIEGLHTLARKFTRRVESSTNALGHANVSTCPGGLIDIDAVIGLLQLINGAKHPELRVRATIHAIEALRQCDFLTLQESSLLTDHYDWLRRFLHATQAESSLTPAGNPEPVAMQQRIAWQLNFRDANSSGDPVRLADQLQTTIDLNRNAIKHLLRDAAEGDDPVPSETELLLDPDPEESFVRSTIVKHGMSDPVVAMRDLQHLADEPVPFLSSRRCRHALATIAPQLLAEIGRTPDPHATLSTLVDVSDSLGGKAVLWELFLATPPTMHLVVRLCACSPYLSRLLIDNPGMIDELVDSLLLNRLPAERWLEANSIELCRSGKEIDPIVGSFKNGAHLQIGVRDVMGKEPLEATHAALGATAESVLRRVAEHSLRGLTERFGDPQQNDGQLIELVMLGLGKLGAREPNYFSDLEVVFLYTGEGNTRRRVGGHRTTTTATNFFAEHATDILLRVNQPRDGAPLYDLRTGLAIGGRATSAAGNATSIDTLRNYFRRGEAALWQRLALCKARAISGSTAARERVDNLIIELLSATEWYPQMATQIRELRLGLEHSAADDNLKRAAGGTVDVELITQMLQLRHAAQHLDLLVPGTTEALQRLADAELLDAATATALIGNYRMLREVESKLCLLDTPQRHVIPEDPKQLELLAFLMDEADGNEILARCRECRSSNRRIFNRLFNSAAQP